MKTWHRYIVLSLILAALALSAKLWLSPLLDFVGTNTDMIQGLESAGQILLGIGFAVSTFLGYRHKPKPQPPSRPGVKPGIAPTPPSGGGSAPSVPPKGKKPKRPKLPKLPKPPKPPKLPKLPGLPPLP